MQLTKDLHKLRSFGRMLLAVNIFYCWGMVFYAAISRGEYIFTSKYFFAAALLSILYNNLYNSLYKSLDKNFVKSKA